MKLNKLLAIVCVLLIGNLGAETIWVVNSQSRTLSRIAIENDVVQNTFASLGNTPNRVAISEDALWVVNSGDNSIQKIDPVSGQSLANHLVEVGSNPWDIVLHEGFGYISGLFSGKVYKMDLNSGNVIASEYVGESPEGMVVHHDKLYVVTTGDYMQNYEGSSLGIIDLASFTLIKRVELPANPQYVIEHEGFIHVSCTGNWADVSGKIVILTEDADVVTTLDIGGTPGNIRFNNENIALVANSGGAEMYSYSFDGTTAQIITGISLSGSDLCGSDDYVALLQANWGENGQVDLYYPDLSFWKSYTIGMMPTDIKRMPSITSVADESTPQVQIGLYPNPAVEGSRIMLKGEIFGYNEISIFNLRGQLIKRAEITHGDKAFDSSGISSGVYFYRLKTDAGVAVGKLAIIRG